MAFSGAQITRLGGGGFARAHAGNFALKMPLRIKQATHLMVNTLPRLTHVHKLVIMSTSSLHTVDRCRVREGAFPIPFSRLLIIGADNRLMTVSRDNRIIEIGADDRTVGVARDDRTLEIQADNRTLEIDKDD